MVPIARQQLLSYNLLRKAAQRYAFFRVLKIKVIKNQQVLGSQPGMRGSSRQMFAF